MEENGGIAGLIVCPICGEATGVGLTRRLDKRVPMEMNDIEPCEECINKVLIAFDYKTHEFVGYIPKEMVMSEEGIERTKDTPLNVLVEVKEDAFRVVPTNDKGEILNNENI